MGVEQRVSKELKPLTIFLSDDELVNFKSHFNEFLNMNCDDKIKKQQEEIEKLKLELSGYRQAILQDKEMLGLKQEIEKLNNIIKEVREYVNNIMFETKAEEKIQDDILEILEKENK